MKITKQIGSNFVNELVAANLLPGPLYWNDNEVVILDAATPEQVASIQAVIDAHDHQRQDIKKQIAEIERDNPLTHRAIREFVLNVVQALGIDIQTASVGIKKVAQLEAQIQTLRSQL